MAGWVPTVVLLHIYPFCTGQYWLQLVTDEVSFGRVLQFAVKTVSDYISDTYGFNFQDRWLYCMSTYLFAFVYRVLAMLATRYINHLKR
jgi:hypothetical protein